MPEHYLSPNVERAVQEYLAAHPDASVAEVEQAVATQLGGPDHLITESVRFWTDARGRRRGQPATAESRYDRAVRLLRQSRAVAFTDQHPAVRAAIEAVNALNADEYAALRAEYGEGQPHLRYTIGEHGETNAQPYTVEKHPVSGAWVVSDLVNAGGGEHVETRTYYGATKREAESAFRQEFPYSRYYDARTTPDRKARQPMTLDDLTVVPSVVSDSGPVSQEPASADPQMAAAPAAVANVPAPVDVGTRFDLLMAAIQGHGVVEDRTQAATGLTCYEVDLGDGKRATLATGVLGWLDAEQQAQLCVRREPLTLPEDAMEHLRTYMAVAESCAGLPGTREVVACVNRELEVRLPR